MTANDFPPETVERFRALVRDFGAEPRRWPDKERGWAEDFAGRAGEAATILAEERAVDAMIGEAVPERASPELFTAILAAREPNSWRRWLVALWPEASPARLAGVCAAALLVGVLFGAVLPVGVAPLPDDDVASAIDEMIFEFDGEGVT